MLRAMAVSGTVPAPGRKPRLDPMDVARWLRRATWLFAAVVLLWLFLSFSTQWVPAGMDTVPTVPPGSWCIVDRRLSSVRVGCDVFVEPPGGGMLLSRVTELGPDTVTVQHPNPNSDHPDSRTFGALARRQLKGMVLVVFPPDAGGGGGR